MEFRGNREAFGAPGITPRWTQGNKEGIGTAYSGDSKIWYTLWRGVVTEVYYPLVDHPQLRDLQILVSDGRTFLQQEKRDLRSTTERIGPHSTGFHVVNADPNGRYTLDKEIIATPHLPVLLEHVQVQDHRSSDDPLTLYLLAAPHLDGGGWGNSGYVGRVGDREVLVAERNGTWLALAASVPFARSSCGFVGSSDGWTDLAQHRRMTWEFDRATMGNIALMGELDLAGATEFTFALAFGSGRQHAVAALLQSLSTPFAKHKARFLDQWDRPHEGLRVPRIATPRQLDLYRASLSTLMAHEDKTFPGAFIASLSIPWGFAKGDADRGGYHLVWTRDLVQIARALLSAGDRETPLRTLIYLAASQGADGGFAQNFWLDGAPYWAGVQLDEVAFPILLAARLQAEGALQEFDPYPMVRRAARFLLEHGPVTQEERWEEASGFSPSTLAATIAAIIVAAGFARDRHHEDAAALLTSYADFLEGHLEGWTVTTQGTLLPGVPRHYIRIHPADVDDPTAPEDPNLGELIVANQAPGARARWPAKDIVDAGFLELVRYGIRAPDDPVIVDSLKVVDAVLKVETPKGPSWRRYNHDGYGQQDDGGPFLDWGVGRAWPLLTGERGQYEVAAGRSAAVHLQALAGFASRTGLLPEQVWDGASNPPLHLVPGGPTGSAMPLAWAHAEFLNLLRTMDDGRVFDRVPAAEARYARRDPSRGRWEIWKPNRRPSTLPAGHRLRVLAPSAFDLVWTLDAWAHPQRTVSTATPLGIEFVDLPSPAPAGTIFEFTFFWRPRNAWEGQNYRVQAL
jgi:glucoamylase